MFVDTFLDYLQLFVSMQSESQVSFWRGDEFICWTHGYLGFQHFPMLTISLAVSANETIRLVVSPRQYLRLVSGSGLFDVDPSYDCFGVSISPSETGLYFFSVSSLFCAAESFLLLILESCGLLFIL